MKKKIGLQKSFARAIFIVVLATVSCVGVFNEATKASSSFDPGRIMDDAVFVNYKSMNASQIQNFLNSKVPQCDTNGDEPSEYGGGTRKQYAASRGVSPPFICLKDYNENGKSAAQIIYDAAQEFKINPQVLIVLLQKEQGLVTDEWPWPIQYRSATGYGCPDTAPCDSDYYGLTNQVRWAARMFRSIMNESSTWYTPYSRGENSLYWHPDLSRCGSSTVNIQNLTTVALYSYTPYRPNQAALNAGYGLGDSCSSYGNRNFYLYFKDWFGSPHASTPFAWSYESRGTYSDANRQHQFKDNVVNLNPGDTAYVTVRARNTGGQIWRQSFVRLGTWNERDRSSVFSNESWLGPARSAQLKEDSVAPGQVGTFEFSITAPAKVGSYSESFNVVADGKTWLNGQNLSFAINVANPTEVADTKYSLSSGEQITSGERLTSQALHSVLTLQQDGNLVLYNDFRIAWSTGDRGSASRLVMQADGNLVLYSEDNQVLWNSETNGNPGSRLVLQTDGNLVIYSQSGQALWFTSTINRPNGIEYVNNRLPVGRMLPGQQLQTPDRRFRLVFQTDGNLVLYSPNRATWSTGTNGKGGASLAMQSDGNLVMYNSKGQPIWSSKTAGRGSSSLTVQQDGNLVIYNRLGTPTWHSRTAGVE